jgi:hypothetical protein
LLLAASALFFSIRDRPRFLRDGGYWHYANALEVESDCLKPAQIGRAEIVVLPLTPSNRAAMTLESIS